MSKKDACYWFASKTSAAYAALVFGLAVLTLEVPANPVGAEGLKPDVAEGKSVATCASKSGSMMRRTGPGNKWQVVREKEQLASGQLLVGLPGAIVDSINGAVRLRLLADLEQNSPYPVKEAGVILQSLPGADLAFVLDRGRIDLTNRQRAGAATVHVSVRNAAWDLVLAAPGAQVALEVYGRWAAGVPFQKKPDPKHEPTTDLVILVLNGEVTLKHTGLQVALHAPPGPAMIEWDSVCGCDSSPQRLEKLPPWATETGEPTAEVKAKKAAIEHLRQKLADHPIKEVLDELLNSEKQPERAIAVYLLAATDNLERLGQAFRETKYPDILDTAIVAMRHWIGRGPGQDEILYNGFIELGKYKPVQAETAMQLLHSFGAEELARPETYQTLIDYLGHNLLGIRALAYWHLSRLVPAGQKLGYNPLEPQEAREAAIQKWKKLVPPGSVPPRPVANGGK
jgi:hypothetical protein